jgi:hypothetical protein
MPEAVAVFEVEDPHFTITLYEDRRVLWATVRTQFDPTIVNRRQCYMHLMGG